MAPGSAIRLATRLLLAVAAAASVLFALLMLNVEPFACVSATIVLLPTAFVVCLRGVGLPSKNADDY